MKKFIRSITLVLLCSMSLSLMSCTTSPTNVVKKYFDQVKKGEKGEVDELLAKAKEEVKDDSTDNSTDKAIDKVEDSVESPEVDKIMSEQLKNLEYTINSETKEGDKATVNVTVKGANFAQAFVGYIQEFFVKTMQLAFSGQEITDEQSDQLSNSILIEHLNKMNMQERTEDITLIKVDGNWQIEPSDALNRLLLGIAEEGTETQR